MARYKGYDCRQTKMILINFSQKILPGSFEYTLSYLVDHELDLSIFVHRYCNDETGAPAYDTALLLLKGHIKKFKAWLDDNDDKPGKTGRAKMK